MDLGEHRRARKRRDSHVSCYRAAACRFAAHHWIPFKTRGQGARNGGSMRHLITHFNSLFLGMILGMIFVAIFHTPQTHPQETRQCPRNHNRVRNRRGEGSDNRSSDCGNDDAPCPLACGSLRIPCGTRAATPSSFVTSASLVRPSTHAGDGIAARLPSCRSPPPPCSCQRRSSSSGPCPSAYRRQESAESARSARWTALAVASSTTSDARGTPAIPLLAAISTSTTASCRPNVR